MSEHIYANWDNGALLKDVKNKIKEDFKNVEDIVDNQKRDIFNALAGYYSKSDVDRMITTYSVKEGEKILSLEDGEKFGTTLSLSYDSDNKKIQLLGIDGQEVGSIDAKDFIIDGMLESVVYNETNNTLVFTWNVTGEDGKSKTAVIEVEKFAGKYTAGDGITIDDNNIISLNNVYNKEDINSKIGTINGELGTIQSNALSVHQELWGTSSPPSVAEPSRIDTLEEEIDLHTKDTNIHVLVEDKTKWNGYESIIKQHTVDIDDFEQRIATLEDDTGIEFYTELFTIVAVNITKNKWQENGNIYSATLSTNDLYYPQYNKLHVLNGDTLNFDGEKIYSQIPIDVELQVILYEPAR